MPDYANRAPRIQPPLPIETIEIPPPPEEEQTKGRGFSHLLMPMIMLLGYLLMGAFGGGRSLLFMIPMGLSVIVTAAISYRNHALEQKQLREVRERYINRLSTLRKEMHAHHLSQRLYYEHTHPPVEVLCEIGRDHSESRLGSRLWERRPFDHDFGSLRLGIGDIESRTIYELSKSDQQQSPLFAEAQQIALDSHILHNAPVIIPLFAAFGEDGKPNIARHSIGVCGKAELVRSFARAQITQFAAMHSPIDSQIHVIGSSKAKADWDWALWLPHTNQYSGHNGDRMCFEQPYTETELKSKQKITRDAPEKFWARIHKELEGRVLRLEESQSQGDVRLPFMLVIVDNLTTETWLDDATSEAAVSLILKRGAELGAALLVLVNEASHIPSDCVGVIELRASGDSTSFQYSEIGLNSARYVGVADVLKVELAQEFAQNIQDKTVRMGYGSDLVTSLSILDLYGVQKIEDLDILTWWERSKSKAEADWLKTLIGKKSGGGDRELYFYQDADGVHGMIAGTTGSGKSELLLTLIAGLAMNYDPSIVNFVLVDYKGGAAFEPFRNLPHVVDTVTNLDGKAVDRMFVAIRSELNRRSKLLADHNIKHIVEYRQKGLHTQQPFPHLFIVVDEFAEMVNDNKEYKDRFDSISRLGRAIGVNLLLATQRPTGAVTDQMRSNMKLKICLRVETVDDSRELLGRPDATFLPSNIPGRAYLQVGKDSPELLQIARAGGTYIEPDSQKQTDDIIFGETNTTDISGLSNKTQIVPPAGEVTRQEFTIVDRIVQEIARLAKTQSEKQHKPWPDPLPNLLPANLPIYARHLNTQRPKLKGEELIIAPKIRLWLEAPATLNQKALEMRRQWQNGQAVDWQNLNDDDKPFQVSIGVIDIPEKAQQLLLNIDISDGPLIVFGAGGWGKTTFLQTLIMALVTQLSPKELHIYALDFGRGGLSSIENLPHLAKPIEVTEEARVERLLRVLADEIDKREPKIRDYGSLTKYNRQNPDAILPVILVVIDNFAEFKETYETQIEALVKLVRAGRSMGIYFAVSADQTGAVPSRVYNLFTQRFALKMANSDDYQTIVGRASSILTEIPGRGVVQIERQPCEFHVAVPTFEKKTEQKTNNQAVPTLVETQPQETENNPKEKPELDGDYLKYYTQIAETLRNEWHNEDALPLEITPLDTHIPLQTLKQHPNQPKGILLAPIGIRDIDRELAVIDLARGPHFLLIGAPVSGKTTALKSLVLGLADRYTPQQLAMILIDPKRNLITHDGNYTLRNLPHVLETVSVKEDMEELLKRLRAEFYREVQTKIREYVQSIGANPDEQFTGKQSPSRHYVIVIDNYDDFGDFEIENAAKTLSEIARKFRDRNIHLVLAGSPEIVRNRDDLLKRVEGSRYALVLQSEETVQQLGGRTSYRMSKGELPTGRGFLIKSGQVNLVQLANTHDDRQGTDQSLAQTLDEEIAHLRSRYPIKAEWYFQGTLHMYDKALAPKAKSSTASEQAQAFVEVEVDDKVAAAMREILQGSNSH